MKIIIVGGHNIFQTIGTYPVINSVKHIKYLIQKNPHEDIEGDIQPSARENTDELRGIIHEIYLHKKKLWQTHVYNTSGYAKITESPYHEVFIARLKEKIPELFNIDLRTP